MKSYMSILVCVVLLLAVCHGQDETTPAPEVNVEELCNNLNKACVGLCGKNDAITDKDQCQPTCNLDNEICICMGTNNCHKSTTEDEFKTCADACFKDKQYNCVINNGICDESCKLTDVPEDKVAECGENCSKGFKLCKEKFPE